jgi:DNA replication initiation complex subunit (GINS family)
MKYDALIADLRCQYERYRGSGTRMEKMLKDACAALEKARLTDAEREAIEQAVEFIDENSCWQPKALRGLLERLG